MDNEHHLKTVEMRGGNDLLSRLRLTYFLVLLVHRALRDDHACAEKYGNDWPRYKEIVPSMFVPGVV